jgi:hypothetical protein
MLAMSPSFVDDDILVAGFFHAVRGQSLSLLLNDLGIHDIGETIPGIPAHRRSAEARGCEYEKQTGEAHPNNISPALFNDFSDQKHSDLFIHARFGKVSRDLGNLPGMTLLRKSKEVSAPLSLVEAQLAQVADALADPLKESRQGVPPLRALRKYPSPRQTHRLPLV